MDKKVKDAVYKYALQNAVRFEGKATPGAITGKIIGEFPELKERQKELMEVIKGIVNDVNSMDVEEQTAKLKEFAPELLEKKKVEKKGFPELQGAEMGKVVTRIPPEPSKYNHIGHAMSFLINYLYAKKYNGKAVLRLEETNPLLAKQEYVDALMEDVVNFLDIKPDKIVYVSDDMPRFYELAEKLISEGKAYVCFCQKEIMNDKRQNGAECIHRNSPVDENKKNWQRMLKGELKEGEAVLRLKIDMKSLNQVMRDPVMMRLVYAEHYRQKDKYKVWPMYDFENSVEEEFCGVTHILRSNEFGTMRGELQNFIRSLFGFKNPVVREYGRINVVGAVTQGREIRELIEQGKMNGWDDPRLVTIRALRRRGIVKEAFYELVNEVGLSKSQTNIDFTVIAAINRRLLDPVAKRFFFISDPVKITVEKAPDMDVELHINPNDKRGGRKLHTTTEFYIEKADFNVLEDGKLYRLMDCLNFVKHGDAFVFDSKEYEKFRSKGAKIIHWIPVSQSVSASVLMPGDMQVGNMLITGVAEQNITQLHQGEIIQFERFGFCRLDSKEKMEFWFSHK